MASAAGIINHRRTIRQASLKSAASAMDILMSMGFPKHRVEKALAATGHQDIQLASDWLLDHVDDPMLDENVPREYVLYACPVGPLGESLDEFWTNSLQHCGRNGAHSLLPHVTLCSFFPCEDSKVEMLTVALLEAVESLEDKAPETVSLEHYSSANFIGLFVEETHAEFMRILTNHFKAEALKKAGVKVDPHKKQLHMTLAYQFNTSHHDVLEKLSNEVDIKAAARWELRLYSRDPRAAKTEVLRVLYSHTPRAQDELELIPDDYIFMSSADNRAGSNDGWYKGTSHQTGLTGMFPGNYTEKAPESDTWTVHRVIPLTKSLSSNQALINLDNKVPSPPTPLGADERRSSQYKTPEGLLQQSEEEASKYANLFKLTKTPARSNSIPLAATTDLPSQPRRLFVIRHAERVDITFGQQWLQHSFDVNGKYIRKNLNMPKRVPIRAGGSQAFNKDPPITEVGKFQARLTGESMRENGIVISHVYSSPALRCVQTAQAVIDGLNSLEPLKIRVDTGLFEWLAWCKGALPKWMTLGELESHGLNVALTYKEMISASDLNLQENCQSYYKRGDTLLRREIKEHPKGDILIVGHASSLDGCTRYLQGLSARPALEFSKIVQKIPYCGAVALQEYQDFGIWDLITPPFATLTHAPNGRFDWHIMQG
ncbi:ubiquitin-associated and SH3 domain-containing protein B-like [Acanthaster planci]|uniref:Ubiquitin-associated and SH3 domain-containing protein B-like n=1 Tax=Acanthaster planci TaxID=133434 RepID=A0A8B7Z2P8_ACAPL|nr:ubiquitin-associated and SH3 domain-containing protein B-like [Acanthaster planci]